MAGRSTSLFCNHTVTFFPLSSRWASVLVSGPPSRSCVAITDCGQTEAFCRNFSLACSQCRRRFSVFHIKPQSVTAEFFVVVVVVFHHHHHYYYHLGMALALAVKLNFCLQVVIHLQSVLAADRYVSKCDASRTETADSTALFCLFIYCFILLILHAAGIGQSDQVTVSALTGGQFSRGRRVSWSMSIPWRH